jgi:hypothetical protein
MTNISDFFKEPDYYHLNLSDKNITINLSKNEQELILRVYDRGYKLNEIQFNTLNAIVSKLKDEIWY